MAGHTDIVALALGRHRGAMAGEAGVIAVARQRDGFGAQRVAAVAVGRGRRDAVAQRARHAGVGAGIVGRELGEGVVVVEEAGEQ
ncbi:hypothetical protein [Haliangium ochraceum]|uniref:hypothetical protein n=1 Tax=Haliangium ochraceum TaxID=80816 RepID=UPI001E5E77C0|nr:hypothetical protein [Haliangium ochraceum]